MYYIFIQFHRGGFPLNDGSHRNFSIGKKGLISIVSSVAILSSGIAISNLVEAADNPKLVFSEDLEWMKSQASLTGDHLAIDFSQRFSHLNAARLQLDATTSQNVVTVSNDKLMLNLAIKGFGATVIKVTATDQNGETVTDQFNLTVSKKGDINGDGIITPADAATIYQVTSGKLKLSEEQLKLLDINGDGQVTNADASLLMSSYVGKSTGTTINDNYFLNLSEVNDAPKVKADTYTIMEDSLFSSSESVLKNDYDIEKNSLTAKVVRGPAHGNLSFNSDGTFTYTPHSNYNGSDQFVYQAHDGKFDSEEETVTLNVQGVNDTPIANAGHLNVTEDVVENGNLTGGDIDSDPLTYIIVDNGSKGTVTITDNKKGTYTYKPNANANGTDFFTFKVNDGVVDSEVVTVRVTIDEVNDAPVAAGDQYTIAEDTSLTATTSILINDSDVENDRLTAKLVTGPAHGNLTLNTDGTFTYVPNENFTGQEVFTYKVSDGKEDSMAETVTIDVTPVNDAPIAVAGTLTVTEDIIKTDTLLGSDIDGDILTYSIVENSSKGTVTITDANAGTFSYQPNLNATGTDSFSFKINDGTVDSQTVTISVNIDAVNDAPVVNKDQYTVSEDTTLHSISSILANDTDVENDSLTATLVTGPANGTLTLNQDGTFTYMPKANFFGQDQFVYKASDGELDSVEETVTIQVTPVNDVPVATAGTLTVTEDTLANGTLVGTDIDGDVLAFSIIENGNKGTVTLTDDHAGTFTYQPHLNATGTDTFTFKINDGIVDSQIVTVEVNINEVNDAPVAIADQFSVSEDATLHVTASILANDTDVEHDSLTAEFVTGPAHGTLTLNADGTLTYIPNPNFAGQDQFIYKAKDGELHSNEQTVKIHVDSINDVPIATAGTLTVTEDEALNGNLEAFDIDGDRLTYTIVENGQKGIVELTGNAGDFTYTPHLNANGTDFFTFKVNDGHVDSLTVKVEITIQAINDVPIITHVSIIGKPMVGETVAGNYTFADVENDPEGATEFQWYRGTKSDGSDKAAVNGANTKNYNVSDEDVGQYLFFEVKPVELSETYFSAASGKIVQRDTEAPTSIAVTPSYGAVDVSPINDLSITFSEKVVAGSGNISIYKNDDTLIATYHANDTTRVTITDNVVTFKHPGFEDFTNYYVTISPNAFHDEAGNPFAGIANKNWTFTTEGQSSALATPDPSTPLREAELKANGAFILIDLTGDVFKDTVSAADFELNYAPTGLTIQDAFVMTESLAMLYLDFDGTDFDANITNFSITAKESGTQRGKSVTTNSMEIFAEVEVLSAYFSEYLLGSNNRSALEVYLPPTGNPDEMGIGYTIETHLWMKNTNTKKVSTLSMLPFYQNMTYNVIDPTFYDLFDLTNAFYYNEEFPLVGDGFVLNALVLKKDGKIVDVIGDPNSNAAKPILPNGGTLVRKSGKIHGSNKFVNNDWDLYPKDTYQFYGRHTN
jgi:VCBS repeat-containing protein